jgi:hypothetical protein
MDLRLETTVALGLIVVGCILLIRVGTGKRGVANVTRH